MVREVVRNALLATEMGNAHIVAQLVKKIVVFAEFTKKVNVNIAMETALVRLVTVIQRAEIVEETVTVPHVIIEMESA